MQMYAIATIPLIKRLRTMLNDVSQFWYADDACASGKISQLRDWWDLLSVEGPKFGYFPNSVKSWVVTKHDHLPTASTLFANTSVKVTSEGRPYLGAAIGSPEYISSFVNNKVFDWSKELDVLTTIASSQPHAAYSAFIHGLSCKWFFLLRTIPNIGHLLKPLEDVIRLKLIPSLTGQAPPNDSIRDLLALPARLGGIAISNPMSLADFEYSSSVAITGPLTSSLVHQVFEFSGAIISEQLRVQSSIRQSRQERLSEVANLLRQSLSPALLRAMDLAQEKGSSSWLTSLPIREFGFSLHRGAFLDALAHSVIIGNRLIFQLIVHVVLNFQSSMHSPVPKVVSPQSATMKFVTLLLTYLLRSVVTFELSQTSSLLLPMFYRQIVIPKKVLDLTLQ